MSIPIAGSTTDAELLMSIRTHIDVGSRVLSVSSESSGNTSAWKVVFSHELGNIDEAVVVDAGVCNFMAITLQDGSSGFMNPVRGGQPATVRSF